MIAGITIVLIVLIICVTVLLYEYIGYDGPSFWNLSGRLDSIDETQMKIMDKLEELEKKAQS